MRAFLVAVLIAAGLGNAGAATLSIERGSILLDGKALTSGAEDSDPVLSPDGKTVVFNRHGSPEPRMANCLSDGSDVNSIELWMVNADGTNPVRLLRGESGNEPEKAICDFANKAFDSTGRLLYFETPAWVTSGAIHVLNMRTRREKYFIAGNSLQVLATCRDTRYRDHIVASQHRYFVFGGSYDWSYLFTPEGKEVGPLGEDEQPAMLDDACGPS